MKKTEAIRWETLEGEGQESNIKHFNPRQSSHMLQSVLAIISVFSLQKSIRAPVGFHSYANARVGSGAPLEPFISLTVRVSKKNEG